MNGTEPQSRFARAVDGFRLSRFDACLLAGTGVFAWAVWGFDRDLALIALLAVGHFFLFCNVFRVRRAYEVSWAALFVVHLGGWLLAGKGVSWGWALGAQLPATAIAIGAEIASGNYHGIGWRLRKNSNSRS